MTQEPLARLLSAATRALVDDLHERLAGEGHPRMRPAYGYALVALDQEPATTAALASTLRMTKQGAAKLVASLEELGYVTREAHPQDARAQLVAVTARGRDLLTRSERIQRELEDELEQRVGPRSARTMRRALERATAGRDPRDLRPIW